MENFATGQSKVKKMIAIIVIIIIALLFGIYSYYGGFYNIKIRTEIVGGETMVYKKVTGDYKQTSSITKEVHDLRIETYKGAGVFYDIYTFNQKVDLKNILLIYDRDALRFS